MAIQFTLGDITTARVDAIVNAANPTLLGGGGVDGALHRAAGGALLTACQALPAKNGVRCQPGEAQITTAGHLAAQYVIHTVGPVYHQDPTPALTLTSAYQHSCELAIANQCKTLAIPAISCGVYGYPHQEAARIALTSCIPFANTLDINFYLFDRALFEVFVAEWQKQQCNIQQ